MLSKGEEILQKIEKTGDAPPPDPRLLRKRALDSALRRTHQQALLRAVYLVLDVTKSIRNKDFPPNRLTACVSALSVFARNFIANNPLSRVGLVIARDGVCELILRLSPDSEAVCENLGKLKAQEGPFSLQVALQTTKLLHDQAPGYFQKEVLVVQSSTSTKDRGDIFAAINAMASNQIRVNIVSLSGLTHIFSVLAKATRGSYLTVENQEHFAGALQLLTLPTDLNQAAVQKTLFKIALPDKVVGDRPHLCACHLQPHFKYYKCGLCLALLCTSSCTLCGTLCALPADIFRKNQFLDSLLKFQDTGQMERGPQKCAGCQQQSQTSSKCIKCERLYCLECDIFIHQTLCYCPNCV